MKTSAPRIVGTGLFAMDVLLRKDGSTAEPKLGGSAGNVLCILGALGWSSVPIGVLGRDGAAHTVRRDFNSVQADMRFLVQTEERSTPVIYQHQLNCEQGSTHRFTFSCPQCGEHRKPFWDCDNQLDFIQSELPPASVFFLDRPTEFGVRLAELYSGTGAIVLFEPSAIGDDTELFARAVRAANIVKYSEDRLDQIEAFALSAAAVEIQTQGPKGLRFRTREQGPNWVTLSAYDLPYMQDTSGAGDWCTAGLIFELFKQQDASRTTLRNHEFLSKALAFGQALSALNCMTEGARGLLSMWATGHILQFAQELQQAHFRSGHPDSQATTERAREASLADLAHKFAQKHRTANLPHYRFSCCSAP